MELPVLGGGGVGSTAEIVPQAGLKGSFKRICTKLGLGIADGIASTV